MIKNIKTLNILDWKKIYDENNDKTIILDVRTSDEFGLGHIKGSINLDFFNENLKGELLKLDKNKTYLIYCKSGGRSYKTLMIMDELNFIDVLDLEGGILAWSDNNFSLIK